MNPPPQQSIGQLQIAAIGLHELYRSYIAAGFSKQQAFELVRTILANGVRQQQDEPPFPG